MTTGVHVVSRCRPSRSAAVVLLVILVTWNTPISARSHRIRQMPHGRAVSCVACHVDSDGGGPRNAFGLDVERLVTSGGRELFWTPELAAIDSDGDGRSNGEELRDSKGAWQQGQPNPGAAELVSNPGYAEQRNMLTGIDPESHGEVEIGETPVERVAFDHHAPAIQINMDTRLRSDHSLQARDRDGQGYGSILVTNLLKQRLDMKLSGWGTLDLDSDDAYDHALDGRQLRISEAWFDLHDLGGLPRLRVGRQYFYDVDNQHFDGMRWTFLEKMPFEAFIFGGRPVSYYSSAGDDWLVGGGVVFKPGWRSRHQIDTYHLDEGGEEFWLSAWRWSQVWGRSWHTYCALRGIDDEVRDLQIHASRYFEQFGLGLNAGYYYQPHHRGEGGELRTRHLSSLGHVLGSRQPYHQFSLNLNKYLGKNWLVQLGGLVRDPRDRGRNSFNSIGSESGHVSATRFNSIIENLDVTAGFQVTKTGQERFRNWVGVVSYRPDPAWDLNMGVTMSRYRFDPVDYPTGLNGQDDDYGPLLDTLTGRDYFFEFRWRPSENHEYRAEVNLNDSDLWGRERVGFEVGCHYHLRRNLELEDL